MDGQPSFAAVFWCYWALMSGVFVGGNTLLLGELTVFGVVLGVLCGLPVALAVAGFAKRR